LYLRVLGSLTIVYGCMFAGKTTLLLRMSTCLQASKYLVFKPNTDTRSSRNTIRTHNHESNACLDVAEPMEILSNLTSKTKYVFIDEVQFMDPTIIDTIKHLLNKDIKVCCAGLLLDARQAYFGSMKTLVSMAAHKIELFANCKQCSRPATVTHYLGSLESQIEIGGKEKYIALCSICKTGTPELKK